MTTHVRTQIRNALAAALAGLATTGANVHVNRSARLSLRQLPAIVLTVEEEEVKQIGNNILWRDLTVAVDGYASATADVDDVIDRIGQEVEVALATAGTLGGLIKAAPALASAVMGIDESIEQPTGRIRMVWHLSTATTATQPDIVI